MNQYKRIYIINTYSDTGFLAKLHYPKEITEFDVKLFQQLIESGKKLAENKQEISSEIIYLTFQLYNIMTSLRYEIISQGTKLTISNDQFEDFYDEVVGMIYGIIECDLSGLVEFKNL